MSTCTMEVDHSNFQETGAANNGLVCCLDDVTMMTQTCDGPSFFQLASLVDCRQPREETPCTCYPCRCDASWRALTPGCSHHLAWRQLHRENACFPGCLRVEVENPGRLDWPNAKVPSFRLSTSSNPTMPKTPDLGAPNCWMTPAAFLSRYSMVLVQMPPTKENPTRPTWMALEWRHASCRPRHDFDDVPWEN